MEKEFEAFWKANEQRLYNHAPLSLKEERADFNKLNSFGDWILLVLPFVVMVGFMQCRLVDHEIANLLLSLVVGVPAFVVSNYLKPFVTGKRSIVDINEDIKRHFYKVYLERGIDYLKSL